MKKSTNHAMALLLASIMALCAMACGATGKPAAGSAQNPATQASQETAQGQEAAQDPASQASQETAQGQETTPVAPAEKNGDGATTRACASVRV